MPVECSAKCGKRAILKRPKTGDSLCKECFYLAFETEIHYTIVQAQLHGAPVQRLASEHPAEGTVVLETHLGHDLVHGPAVQVLIGQDLQRDLILVSVPLDCLQTIIAVASDSFINGQQYQLQLVILSRQRQ